MAASCDQIDASTSAQRFAAAVAAIKQKSTLYLQEALTKTGSDVIRSVDNEGRSILHWAVMVGSEDILQMILEYISLNQSKQPSFQTPAAPKQDVLLQLMLAPDRASNKSPFGMAILAGAAMKVYLLVKHEPLGTVWTAHQSDACAIQIASSMLRGPKKFRASEVLNAMLVGVIESKSPLASSLTQRLLSSGAAADTWAPSGLSALMSASSTKQTDVAALLIAGSAAQERSCPSQQPSGTGATIELADAQGRTALMHAAMNNCVSVIRLLLAHGAQVDAEDLSRRRAIDLCAPKCEAAGLLKKHMLGLESKVDKAAAVIIQEEAESNVHGDRQRGHDKKSLMQSHCARQGKHGNDSCSCVMEGMQTETVPMFDNACCKKEQDIRKEAHSSRTTCTIGAEHVPHQELSIKDVLTGSSDGEKAQWAGVDDAAPWQIGKMCVARKQGWYLSQSQGHSSHNGQIAGSAPSEPQRQKSPDNEMSTFKQFFYVRDCSAAAEGPSSRIPDDPSSNGCKSDVDDVELGVNCMGDKLVEGVVQSVDERGNEEMLQISDHIPQASNCRASNLLEHGTPTSGLVAGLAAQVVSLQEKMDSMESRHQIDMHEAVLETVQQMEGRLLHGSANLAAQLTWNELHRTGLAALYCAVIQGALQHDVLKAVTTKCISGPTRQTFYPHGQGAAPPPPPPPPPRPPPPSLQGSPPVVSSLTPLMFQPPPFLPFLAPPPPGSPARPTHTNAGERGMLDLHQGQGQMSPLSNSHRVSGGSFSANAKPFSPLSCEWNSPNSIWAVNGSAADGPRLNHESGVEERPGLCIPRSSCGVPLLPANLHLPDSLPGSIGDPGVSS